MGHELGWQLADNVARELALEDEVGPAAKVERYLRLRLIHRQHEAVAADAALVADGLLERGAEGEAHVLDRVVLVDLKVALALDGEADAGVLRDLLQHMVEKADAGSQLRRRSLVQVHRDGNFGLLGVAHDGRTSWRINEQAGDFRPTQGLPIVA